MQLKSTILDIPTNMNAFPWGTALLVAAVVVISAVISSLITARRIRRKAIRRTHQVSVPQDMPTEVKGITRITVGNINAIGSRENQEDAFGISDLGNPRLCRERGILAVVADGMGGLDNGEAISSATISTFLNSFPKLPLTWTPEQMLLYMANKANANAEQYTGGESGKCGSTVVTVMIRNSSELSFLSVGDSRIYLCRKDSAIQLNRSHTYGMELDRLAANGNLSFEDATDDHQRGALVSYIGMGKLKYVDFNTRPIELLPGDRVILMSDGVFGTLSDKEIISALTANPQESAEIIEQMIVQKAHPHQDNFTLIILQFD